MKKKIVAGMLLFSVLGASLLGCSLNVDKINKIIQTVADGDTQGDTDNETEGSLSGNTGSETQNNGVDKPDDGDTDIGISLQKPDDGGNVDVDPGHAGTSNVPIKHTNKVQIGQEKKGFSDYSTQYQTDMSFGQYPLLTLDEEGKYNYPGMQQALEELSYDCYKSVKYEYEEIYDQALTSINNGYFMGPFYVKQKAYVRRADEGIVSILMYYEGYAGGVHGSIGYDGYNYYTVDGTRVHLPDVVNDFSELRYAVKNEIKKNYSYLNGYESIVDSIITPGNSDSIAWTLDYNGITIYFGEYCLGSYADGTQVVTISAKEYPNCLNKVFFDEQEYAFEIPNGMPVYIDLDGDSECEKVESGFYYNPEEGNGDYLQSYYYDAMATDYYISVDGFSTNYKKSASEVNQYMVHTEDGDYIYLFCDDDMISYLDVIKITATGVKDLDTRYGISLDTFSVNEANGDTTYYELKFLDPWYARIMLRTNVFSVYYSSCPMYVCKYGLLEKYNEIIYNSYDYGFGPDDYMPYVHFCLKDISIKKVYEDGVYTGESYNLKVGEKIRYLRTDGVKYVDFLLPDGSIGRIVMVDFTIEGTGSYSYEYFDGIWCD